MLAARSRSWMFGEQKKGSPVDFLRERPKREGGRRGSGGGYPDKDATEARFASRKGEQGGGTRDGQRTEVDETGKGGRRQKYPEGPNDGREAVSKNAGLMKRRKGDDFKGRRKNPVGDGILLTGRKTSGRGSTKQAKN